MQPSVAVELWERKGWSVDAIATTERAGAGIARDLWSGLDVGVYGTVRFDLEDLDPSIGVGLHWNW